MKIVLALFATCALASAGLMANETNPLHSDTPAANNANHDVTPETTTTHPVDTNPKQGPTSTDNQHESPSGAAPLLGGNKEQPDTAPKTKDQKPSAASPAAPANDSKYKKGLVVPPSVKQTSTSDKKTIPASPIVAASTSNKSAAPVSSSATAKPKTNKTEPQQPKQKAEKLATNIRVANATKPGPSVKSSPKTAAQPKQPPPQTVSQNANKTMSKPAVKPAVNHTHAEDPLDVKWATKSVRKFFRTMIDMMDWDNLHVSNLTKKEMKSLKVREVLHCISPAQRDALNQTMVACEGWAKTEHQKIVKQEIELAKNHSGHFDEHLHLSERQKKDASNTMKEVMVEQCFIRALVADYNQTSHRHYVNLSKLGMEMDHLELSEIEHKLVKEELAHCVQHEHMDAHGLLEELFKHEGLVRMLMSSMLDAMLNGHSLSELHAIKEMKDELPLYKGMFCTIESLAKHQCMDPAAVKRVHH